MGISTNKQPWHSLPEKSFVYAICQAFPPTKLSNSRQPAIIGSFLSTNSPALHSKNYDLPCHQQPDKSHGDGVHEHLIEVVMDHPFYSILTLSYVSWLSLLGDGSSMTYTSHKYYTSRNQTEGREQLSRRSGGKYRFGWLEKHQDIRQCSGKGRSKQEVSPLFVDHV